MFVLKNKYFWILLSIILFVFVVSYSLPKPISMDLKQVGNGLNSVVFIYDLNLSVSNQQATEMNKAREIVGDNYNFLVLKAGNPKTKDFKDQYRARAPELLFFSANGDLIDRKMGLLSANQLIEKLSYTNLKQKK
ncbi:MAG: hypothetical protein MI867_11125 [Pseudomonadales bacterium]|nr:hypothetical protein [Pseudomonadales bacterium]